MDFINKQPSIFRRPNGLRQYSNRLNCTNSWAIPKGTVSTYKLLIWSGFEEFQDTDEGGALHNDFTCHLHTQLEHSPQFPSPAGTACNSVLASITAVVFQVVSFLLPCFPLLYMENRRSLWKCIFSQPGFISNSPCIFRFHNCHNDLCDLSHHSRDFCGLIFHILLIPTIQILSEQCLQVHFTSSAQNQFFCPSYVLSSPSSDSYWHLNNDAIFPKFLPEQTPLPILSRVSSTYWFLSWPCASPWCSLQN